ncbi:type II and III secretion system protein family protein [Acidicapsa ligni]|uniref:type II and III secretion system protein family protein n=1 Tax=Acidicapsa ligni TaxID=542300 RepID=UPI0021E0C040|nr:pilus assembly protein N-terminal domain-containing protein [Acidicapsa ligni]
MIIRPRTSVCIFIRLSSVLALTIALSAASGQSVASKQVTPAIAEVVSDVSNFSSVAPSEKPLHVVVGRSVFIYTKHRLTRVYVTNPAILSAYVASPNQLLVTSKTAGLSSLVVWDETGESQPYLVSSDLDLDKLRSSISESMHGEDIHVEGDGNRIILSGVASGSGVSDAAIKLAGLYSKDISDAMVINSAHVPQVKLKVRIVEVDRAKLTQFGFNFFSAGGNNLAQTTTTQFPSTLTASTSGTGSSTSSNSSSVGNKTVSISNPLNFLLYNSSLNVGAMLQDLQNMSILQILAEPTLTTLSGKEASFLSGGEFPFPVVQGIAGGLTSISIQFRPYGVKLDFTPEVNVDGTIQLKIAPEVSALDYTNAVTIDGYQIPAISTRRADTEVVLKSGQSFAISGLLDRRTTDAYGRTPGFSSIPILGQLFKSKSLNHSTTELIVIVTPEVVNPMEEGGPIKEPVLPVPTMDPTAFDTGLPKTKKDN